MTVVSGLGVCRRQMLPSSSRGRQSRPILDLLSPQNGDPLPEPAGLGEADLSNM